MVSMGKELHVATREAGVLLLETQSYLREWRLKLRAQRAASCYQDRCDTYYPPFSFHDTIANAKHIVPPLKLVLR